MASQDIEPVVRSVVVNRSAEVAFKTFTEGIASWWPIDEMHSIGEDKVDTVIFEDRAGGRVYELWKDGHQEPWADILVWEPPQRVVLAWHPNPEATVSTEVEVSFSEEGETTRVTVEHRNWHVLGDRAQEMRDQYASGWPGVLELFRSSTL